MRINQLSGVSDARLIDPKTIKCKIGGNDSYLVLHKEALRTIYWKLGLSSSVSEKIYQISQEIWNDVINLKMSQCSDFDFGMLRYITIRDFEVIAITENDMSELIDNFYKDYDSIETTEVENNSDVIQVKLSQDIGDGNYALVLLDIDVKNGVYRAYDGIHSSNRILLPGLPAVEESSLESFLTAINLKDELNMSAKLSKSLIKEYDRELAKTMILSLREVLDIVRMAKLKVELSNDGMVSRIEGIDDTDDLIAFLNSFGMPYKSLKKLTYLKKSLKYDDLTVDGMLSIFAREYDSDMNSISAYLISYLMKIYYSQESDRNTVKSELSMR